MEAIENIADSGEVFSAAMELYGRAMFRAARSLLDSDADAEDAVGEAVVLAWRSWNQLRDPAAVRPWLLKITVNCAHAQRRKLGRVTAVEDMELLAETTVDRPYENLWEAISALPPDHRTVITLFYYEDMTVKEIAQILHVARGTVKSRLNRARNRLKELLCEEGA